MVAAAVVCAETDERARFLAGSGALSFLRLRSGRPGPMPSPEEAAAHPYTSWKARSSTTAWPPRSSARRRPSSAASPTSSTASQADELMITTMVYDPADRLSSFERVAALARAHQAAPSTS